MPFPVEVESGAGSHAMLPNLHSQQVGPFYRGTDRYLVLVDTNIGVAGSASDHTVRVWKSTDAGLTWIEQDSANRRALKYEPTSYERNGGHVISVARSGDVLHIARMNQDANDEVGDPGDPFVKSTSFNLSTDLWSTGTEIALPVVRREQIIGGGIAAVNLTPAYGFFLAYRAQSLPGFESDAPYGVFLYQSEPEDVGGTLYNRVSYWVIGLTSQNSSVTSGLVAKSADANHYGVCGCVTDGVGRVHFFYQRIPNTGQTGGHALCHRALLVNGTLGAKTVITEVYKATNARVGSIGTPIIENGELIIPYFRVSTATERLPSVARAAVADVPTFTTENVLASPIVTSVNTSRSAIAVVGGGNLTVFWHDPESASGLSYIRYASFQGSGWSTYQNLNPDGFSFAPEAIAAGRAQADRIGVLHCNEIDGSYQGPVSYWEVDVAGGGQYPALIAPTAPAATGAHFPSWEQGFVGPFETDTNTRYIAACNKRSGSPHYVAIYKSTDQGLTWTEIDAADHITTTGNGSYQRSDFYAIRDGNKIQISYQRVGADLAFKAFNLVTEQWETAIAAAFPDDFIDWGDVTMFQHSPTKTVIARRSTDGSYWFLHPTAQENIAGTDYDRVQVKQYVPGDWQPSVDAFGSSGEARSYTLLGLIEDNAGRLHLIAESQTTYNTGQPLSLYHRSVSSGNVLSAVTEIVSDLDVYTAFPSEGGDHASPIIWDGSKLWVGFSRISGATNYPAVAYADPADSPIFTEEYIINSGTSPFINDIGTVSLTSMSDRIIATWIDKSVTPPVLMGAARSSTGWTTPVELAEVDDYTYTCTAALTLSSRVGIAIAATGNFRRMAYVEVDLTEIDPTAGVEPPVEPLSVGCLYYSA